MCRTSKSRTTPVAAILLIAALTAGCAEDRDPQPAAIKQTSAAGATRHREANLRRLREEVLSNERLPEIRRDGNASRPSESNDEAERSGRRQAASPSRGGNRPNRVGAGRLRSVPSRSWNILLIVADGLSRDWISCCGGTAAPTPNIDELAETGVTFHNVYAMPHNVASQVTLLTGSYPHRHGWIGDWNVAADGNACWFDWNLHRCLPRQQQMRRYMNCVAGQWMLNNLRAQPDALLQHGFRRWCVSAPGGPRSQTPRQSHRNPHVFMSSPISREDDGIPNRDVLQSSWGVSGTFTGQNGPDLFSRFLQAQRFGRSQVPFFMYYSMNLPGPQESHSESDDSTGGTERYSGLVRDADRLVGEAVEWLNDIGVRHRTIVVFTCSSGVCDGNVSAEPGPGAAAIPRSLSERSIRVPLIVSCPDVTPAGIETDCLVDFTDVCPTLCQIAALGRPVHGAFDGVSFWPEIVGEEQQRPRQWIMSLGTGPLEFDGQHVRAPHRFSERVLRDRRFKVHVNHRRQIDGLWDLQADPDEQRNLISSASEVYRVAVDKFQAVVDGMPAQDAELECSSLLETDRRRDATELRQVAAEVRGR